MSRKLGIAINAVGFQVGWWACVLGAGWGKPLLGPLVISAFVVQQLLSRGADKSRILVLVLLAITGTVLDSLMSLAGIVCYEGGYGLVGWIAPLWITAMWTGFALTVDSSLGFLRNRLILSAVAGAAFGPLAYFTAERFGAVTFGYSNVFTIAMLAFVWAVMLSAIFNIPQSTLLKGNDLSVSSFPVAENSGR